MVGINATVAFLARRASTARRRAGTVRTTMGVLGIWARFLLAMRVSDVGVRWAAQFTKTDALTANRCRSIDAAVSFGRLMMKVRQKLILTICHAFHLTIAAHDLKISRRLSHVGAG
ncbi:hypothetical protein [Bradyrhizobium genosp. P]|uniref:hypothetical protein n=1 Tax=Bradyrhizobium genosp. P TaxID=83641 RepID=UPI003CECECD9